MMRIMDPKNRSPTYSFIEGKIVGGDAGLLKPRKHPV
jgi:hypothetical protein